LHIHQNYFIKVKMSLNCAYSSFCVLSKVYLILHSGNLDTTLLKLTVIGSFVAHLCLFQASYAQSSIAGMPFIRNFSTQDYQAGIQNWDIAQDSRGILYVANNFGLLEYDGSHWGIHAANNGSKMRSVAIDPSGKIYVGCQGEFGYFFPNQTGRLVYTSLADKLPPEFRNFDETWNLFLDQDKQYFCTFSNIFLFTHDSINVIQPEHPLELSFFVNREVWADERGRGLTRIEQGKLQLIPGGEFFKDIRVSSVLSLYGDRHLISTFSDGIFEYSPTEIKPWRASMQSVFKQAIVNTMVRLRNGNYAIGTQNNGLFIVSDQGEVIQQFTAGRGLSNRTVLTILEDDLQNLWIGLNNGLSYIELGSPFTYINEELGLPGTGYAAYLDNTLLYMGTNTGLYKRDISVANSEFELVEGSQGQVYHIGKYGGDVLMGHHNGAFQIKDNRAQLLSDEPGSWIFQQVLHRPDYLIGGVYGGLQLFKRENNRWAFYKKIEFFKESSRIMEQDRDGNLWITHGYKGVFRLNNILSENPQFQFYSRNEGFPSNVLINVYKIRNELIFTSENGIYRHDNSADRFVRDNFFTKHFGEAVQMWSIQQDALGRIYFLGKDGIGVMHKSVTNEYQIETNSFNTIRRFLNDDLETMIVLSNNEVLYGAKEGFVHYNPNYKSVRDSHFKSLIRQFATVSNGDSVIYFGNFINGGRIVSEQTSDYQVKLPYKNNSVSIGFSATSFESDEQVQHQFYMEGFEKNWSEWSPIRVKEYTNLREGEYTFHVRSKNAIGEISDSTMFKFTILPPWYRTVWAYCGYAFVIFASLFAGFKFVDRRHQYEKRVLELKQKKELIRKDHEMESMAEKSQQEITRLMNEKLESELRHKNKELATSTVLILNKNEFMMHLKDNIKSIAKNAEEEGVSKELNHLVVNIETNLSSDEDWEQFQVHFDNVHGDFSRRFRVAYPTLSPQEMKLSAYLRMNLSTKEIANLLNISVRGVEISRYRLRKKLGLERSLNLQEFILNF
jgi:ligand-binding sensor domain-containing protein/DNA-binding CsgD family transcriptional regulator